MPPCDEYGRPIQEEPEWKVMNGDECFVGLKPGYVVDVLNVLFFELMQRNVEHAQKQLRKIDGDLSTTLQFLKYGLRAMEGQREHENKEAEDDTE